MSVYNKARRGGYGAEATIVTVVVAVLVMSVPVRAQHPDAGTVAFPFLNMGYEARAVAMGGAAVAMPNDISGALSNPAAMGFENAKKRGLAGYRQLFMDVWGGPLGVAFPLRGGTFAASLITLTTGDFDIIDEDGNKTGLRASSSYTALGVSYATVVYDNLSVGGTVKGVYHYIGAGDEAYSADGYVADVGVQYRLNSGRLIYGLALRNFGVMRSGYAGDFDEHPMPNVVEIGVSYVPRHIRQLRVALDVNKARSDYLNFEPGVEYTLFANTLFLRGGYTFSYMDIEKALEVLGGDRDDTYRKSNINTFSAGLGLTTVIDGVDVNLDTAIQFYTGISQPAFVISVAIGF